MELFDVMRTTFAGRAYTGDPLPDATLYRKGWRVIVVRDPATRKALAQLTEPAAKRYLAQVQNGENPWNTIDPPRVDPATIERTPPAPHLTDPVLKGAAVVLVVCVDLKVVASTDQNLARVGVISGASIYPFVSEEPRIQALLGIPPHVAVAAVMPLGRPAKALTRLKRKPVQEFAMLERWGGAPLTPSS
jgi:nitroreductase